MLGALITLLVASGWACLGWRATGRVASSLDPAERLGVSGLFGLAGLGLLTFFLGLLPGGFDWGVWVVTAASVVGLLLVAASRPSFRVGIRLPRGWRTGILLLLAACLALALVGVLGPSDPNDWDSLAYHLAVPKLWNEAGRMVFVPTIHHSNFPFLVDNLYVWGLQWGSESGAKAFAWSFAPLGALTLFGIGRRRYGDAAGWWAALALVGIPVVVWESGTAYVDVAHGLFSGLGVLYAAESLSQAGVRPWLGLSALMVGFACASKYTGLQVLAAVALTLAVGFLLQRSARLALRSSAMVIVAGIAIASPWYAKNLSWTGNPVYPFFYEVFGSSNWSPNHARIYQSEQRTFGVGRADGGLRWLDFPHAVLGLAYQPGRYVNPGQSEGLGMPTGALGFVPLAALLLWPLCGRAKRFESAVLGAVLVCFVAWFALSQQSRYALNMGVPLSLLVGGAVTSIRAGPLLAIGCFAQAAATLWVVWTLSAKVKLPVAIGSVSEEAYREAAIPFAASSKVVNEVAKGGKVALFDEVFGYLLNVPYAWANPGHSTLFRYEQMADAKDLVSEFRRQGFTHVYVSFAFQPSAPVRRWISAAGLGPSPEPYSPEERRAMMDNFELRWKPLLAEAAREGALRPVWASNSGALFSIRG